MLEGGGGAKKGTSGSKHRTRNCATVCNRHSRSWPPGVGNRGADEGARDALRKRLRWWKPRGNSLRFGD